MGSRSSPSQSARKLTEEILTWYMRAYFRRPEEPGTLQLLSDHRKVGAFAVPIEKIRANDPRALFRLLVSSILFQRRRDCVVRSFMLRLAPTSARELLDSETLLRLSAHTICGLGSTLDALVVHCDVSGRPSGLLSCSFDNTDHCHIKRHSRLLRRYGDFGKAPTSAAQLLAANGVNDLPALRAKILSEIQDERQRACELERQLCRIFRVDKKIAAMFLSWLCNPDLTKGAPWEAGIDWTYFVVIDSNVDAFLGDTNYCGGSSYEAKRQYISNLAAAIDLSRLDASLHPFNPRLVQQAIYVFKSVANRVASGEICLGEACTCASDLGRICPLAHAKRLKKLPPNEGKAVAPDPR